MIFVKALKKIDVHELLYNLGNYKKINFKQLYWFFLSLSPPHTLTHFFFITKLTVYTCLLLLLHHALEEGKFEKINFSKLG